MSLRRLEFIGDQTPPDAPSKVHARRPLFGQGERPQELLERARHRSYYIPAGDAGKPQVRIERVDDEEIWRIDFPVDPTLVGARPGREATRVSPQSILEETDNQVPFTAMRPQWADLLYVPRRAAVEHHSLLRRFNGRRVRPLWVFGNDDRWQFRDPAWPWGLVGRIFNNQGFSGTGALIGDRLVITAGHMVPWGDEPWWMTFVPAYYDGTSLHGAGVESYVSDARGYDPHGNVTGYDWAVLRLYEPLGRWLGYFGYNGYSEDWEDQGYWSIIGFPGAVANAMRPSFQGSITVSDLDSDDNGGAELESDTADISPGDSGGPLFGWWGNDPRIVGVVSGEEEYSFLGLTFDQDNVMAGGSGFTSLAAWGRTNWPL
jgi:V8-like Glu-specific endopeptidase